MFHAYLKLVQLIYTVCQVLGQENFLAALSEHTGGLAAEAYRAVLRFRVQGSGFPMFSLHP